MIFVTPLLLSLRLFYNCFPNALKIFVDKGKSLTLRQVFGSSFNVPIYKGILPDIRSLLPVPNFPNMINPTQIRAVRPLQTVAYSFPSLFPRVRFKKCA